MMSSSFARAVLLVSVFVTGRSVLGAGHAEILNEYLTEGRLAEAAIALRESIETTPDDQEARFGLGIVRFLQAIEGLGQDQFRYGLFAQRTRTLPFMRLPIKKNPQPEQISYEKARGMLTKMLDRVLTAEAVLADIEPDGIRLPLKVTRFRLDLDGDGTATKEESLGVILAWLQPQRSRSQPNPTAEDLLDLSVTFDDADAVWLRGYCHVLAAMLETILAWDWQDQFERTAHLFYPLVKTPYDFLGQEGSGQFMGFGTQNLLDAIAWIHTINYPVAEPERMKKSLKHLEMAIQLSRENWKLILAETDNEREWVPNPNQAAAIPGLRVGNDIVSGWHDFLDEMEAILQGKKLVPFWRGIPGGISPRDRNLQTNPDVGINVRRIFTEPTRFDLVLWTQGTGLEPYLEKGEIIEPKEWRKMMSQFRGQFLGFAVWFN